MSVRVHLLAALVLLLPTASRAFEPRLAGDASVRRVRPLRSQLEDNADEESNSMGNWRQVRAQMAKHGVPVAGDENLGGDQGVQGRVSKLNEALLQAQNPKLGKEFKDGVWAHQTPFPEAGGLLLRTPFDEQLLKNPGPWRRHILDAVIEEAEAMPIDKEQTEARIEKHLADPVHMMKVVEALVEEEMESIMTTVQEGRTVSALQADLLQNYEDHANAWQEVLLITADDKEEGTKAVVINRPLGQGVSPSLAVALFEKYLSGDSPSEATKDEISDLNSFVTAFEQGPVYAGGPEDQETMATLLHGYPLPGAREIASGTQIYEGGFIAATNSVRKGECKPIDFRIFVGQRRWAPGKLREEIKHGLWIPVAASRTVALKQCLGLPKPLWHEVMELVGGQQKDVSELELQRRGMAFDES